MNKEFFIKMIKAEVLRYEAFKEIMPDNLRERIESVEKNTSKLLKDIAIEMVSESFFQQENRECDSVEKVEKHENKQVKKVKVDFN